jgi:hypothetical protein
MTDSERFGVRSQKLLFADSYSDLMQIAVIE